MRFFHHKCYRCGYVWCALRPHRTMFGSPMCPACELVLARMCGYLNRRHVDNWAKWERVGYGDSASERIAEAYRVLEADEALRATELSA